MKKNVIAGVAVILGLAFAAGRPVHAQKLAERHKTWLESDVVYIISKEERDLFMRLASDPDRERYVEQFWARRDPTPGTPENEFKEEHYKRIKHANAYFGGEWNTDGWRTDRGKIYIILGPPATRQFHVSGGQVYPIELWFYNNPQEPSLPPFFNVMFFQKDGISDFRLYSPYLDGPTKLVRASGTENRNDRAYRFLRGYNVELARASLSLIPSEPVDADASSPSLSSDSMLRKIINLADDKFHKQRLGLTAQLQQDVSVRLIPDESNLRAVAVPIIDVNGNSYVHYALQTSDPSTFALGRYKDKLYLALETQVKVLDAKTKAVVKETTREAVSYFDDQEAEEVKSKPISFEDRIALPPGNYQIEFGMLNRLTRLFTKASLTVHIDSPSASEFSVGKPVLVRKCQKAADLSLPFVFGSFRCGVSARNEVQPAAGASLNILYPVTVLPKYPAGAPPLKVQYTMGRLDRGAAATTIEDALDAGRFDSRGTLYVGKSIPLNNLPDGSYLLSVQVIDPRIKRTAGATFSFRVASSGILHYADYKVVEPSKSSERTPQ